MDKRMLNNALEIIKLQQESEYCNGVLTIHSKSLSENQGYYIKSLIYDINEINAHNLTSLENLHS